MLNFYIVVLGRDKRERKGKTMDAYREGTAALQEMAVELVKACDDTELLDFIIKLLAYG